MQLRNRIVTASMAAGCVFTLLLGWLLYGMAPASDRYLIAYSMFSNPATSAMASVVVLLFWWLIGSIAGGIAQRRLDQLRRLLRKRVQEAGAARKHVEKQRAQIAQFAASTMPVASGIVGQAGEISLHSQTITDKMAQCYQAMHDTNTVQELLSTSGELNGEIAKSDQEARAGNIHMETAAFMLDTLRQNIPSLKEHLQLLDAMARHMNLLALNASIEAARAGASHGLALVAGDVKELSDQTAEAAFTIQQQLGAMEDFSSRSLAALDPLVTNLRQLSLAFATLSALAGSQCQAAERLAEKSEKAKAIAAPEEFSRLKQKLLGVVQSLAEQTALLQHSLESLNLRLKTA